MNRRRRIVFHRSPTRRTRFAAQILLRGASRRAARVFKTDALGQVVSARFGEDADPDLYAYDFIGNFTSNCLRNAWAQFEANELNEYVSITNHPNHLTHQNHPNHPNHLNLSYDSDGNLLTNGVWSYAYDLHNRLTTVWSNDMFVLENRYDFASRRILRRTPAATHRYCYDGWNPVCELVVSGDATNRVDYFWGKDLSGTLQGAGGVGGLLAVRNGGVDYYPAYDDNGNTVAYADGSGAVVASYAYDAFGNMRAASGPLASAFAHQFSTKPRDPETGLYYYGYRFYAPVLGRWNNKDLLEEQGGWNLFSFCTNDPLLTIDLLGLQSEEHSEAQKCCCECIDSIRIELISNPNGQYVTNPEIGQLLFGHEFYVVVSISRGEADPESDYAPSLKWNEKITYSIGEPIQKEVISEHPESAQSQSWTNRTNLCEGSQDTTEIRIHDYSTIPIPPAYPEGQRKYFYRKVQFTFTGENSPSCSCKQPTVSQAATQTLSVINDAIATSSFVVGE